MPPIITLNLIIDAHLLGYFILKLVHRFVGFGDEKFVSLLARTHYYPSFLLMLVFTA
jgi:hypothetical protein